MQTINDYRNKRKQIQKEIEECSFLMEEKIFSEDKDSRKKYLDTNDRLNDLLMQRDACILSEMTFDSPIIGNNEKIDLYRIYDGYYIICKHDTHDYVGRIALQETNPVSIYYEVDYKHRGNGYALDALCMLTDYLEKNNIPEMEIFSKIDNAASIRVIEKFTHIRKECQIRLEENNLICYLSLNKKKTKK